MDELLEQFLIESRELVEQASADLMALEAVPANGALVDGVFRAFHTLKGAAGIVDFAAMGRLMHAAEEALSEVRGETRAVTPELVSACLACLDRLSAWLEAMERSGAPGVNSEAEADTVIARLTHGKIAASASSAAESWHLELLKGLRTPVAGPLVALRYRPAADCFFRGIDPLAYVSGLQGLMAFACDLGGRAAQLDAFDPFNCQMTFRCLVAGAAEEVAARFGEEIGKVEVLPIDAQQIDVRFDVLNPVARALLTEQLALLQQDGAHAVPAVVASARQVAGNICRHLQLTAEAATLQAAPDGPQASGLIAAIDGLLSSSFEPAGKATNEGLAFVAPAAQRLRVDVERIDALVKLTGELLVLKNAVGHTAGMAKAGRDLSAIAALLEGHHNLFDRLVAELQRTVLSVRVLPLGQIFQRYPRLVRELAESLGKSATLVIEGEGTEADKTVAEALAEPLLHVLRNAMDHGIEPAGERVAAGKPATAQVHLRASRSGEQIVIEIEDDGRGIDIARVRQVAEERGVASPAEFAAMTDLQAMNLIFAPGFSTASEITDISGRGVGMDVVRTTIGRLGGEVSLSSRPGQGTTVRFSLPFTVMMSRLMTVEVGGQAFGVPLDAVVETLRLPRACLTDIGSARAFVLRDRTIPLIDLGKALNGTRANHAGEDATIVVLSFAGQYGAIEVERVGARLDAMLRPLTGLLSGIPGIAGTTLLGDGRVLLVLNLEEFLA